MHALAEIIRWKLYIWHMENIETLLYIAIGVVYLISRVLKARKKAAPPRPRQTPQAPQVPTQGSPQQTQPKKTFSFEDILKEFEQSLSGEDEYEEPEPVREVREEIPRPVAAQPQERKPSRYEAYEGTAVSSKESEESLEGRQGEFSRNEKYSIKEDVVNDYVKMLQDPDGFKNAIVLSEIINRKYF